MTDEQIQQARKGLGGLIIMMSVYVGAGLVLFVMNLVNGFGPLALWNAAWLLFVPWTAGWSIYELRRSSRALRSLSQCPGERAGVSDDRGMAS